MKILKTLTASVLFSAVLTAVMATASIIYLMFSSGEDDVEQTGFFDSVYFKSQTMSNGDIDITMGVDSYVNLIYVFVAVAIVTMLVVFAFGRWRSAHR